MDRGQLRRVETYDGNAKRPVINQMTGEDSTTSQAFWTSQSSVITASVPKQLLDKVINPGMSAFVKAKMANSSDIHIGHNSTVSQWTRSRCITLIQGESHPFPVDNFNRLYINSSNSGDGVELTLGIKQ